jgi:hypothetical protein
MGRRGRESDGTPEADWIHDRPVRPEEVPVTPAEFFGMCAMVGLAMRVLFWLIDGKGGDR